MALLLFANDATGQLAGAISNTAVSVTLEAGQGALFPNPGAGFAFVGTFVDAATGLLTEIVSCTARSTDTITIVRAQEGTTALNWNAGDFFSNLWTAGSAAQMLQQGQAPASQVYYGASDTGSVNAIVTTVSPTLGALTDGQIFEIQPAFTNTSPTVTINISAFGNVNGFRSDGSALLQSDYLVGSRTLWAYKSSGPSLYLLNPATWVSQPPPQKLTTSLTLYVSPTGSDSNNGLTSGTAFATLQHAWNILVGTYNLNGNSVTIQLADGTYTGGLLASTMPVGASSTQAITIAGDSGTPSNVLISTTSTNCISANGPAGFVVQNMKLTSSTGNLIVATNGSSIAFQGIVFGPTSANQATAEFGGSITAIGNYSIVGGALSHVSAVNNGVAAIGGVTVTLSGTPAFSTAFAISSSTSTVSAVGNTFTGSATGSRWSALLNGVIYTNTGASSTYFPGSSNGGAATGGQYV